MLLVEDSADLRDLYAEALRFEGFRLIEARHGLEALEILRKIYPLPEIILLDIMMPVMDGLEFLQEREDLPHARKIPVIIVSASRQLIPDGIDFLTKPVDLNSLINKISDCLQKVRNRNLNA